MITADRDEYFNVLNFDFDIASNDDVYMVSADDGELQIKQYDASANIVRDLHTQTIEPILDAMRCCLKAVICISWHLCIMLNAI